VISFSVGYHGNYFAQKSDCGRFQTTAMVNDVRYECLGIWSLTWLVGLNKEMWSFMLVVFIEMSVLYVLIS